MAYTKAQMMEIANQLATAYHEGEKEILNRLIQANLTEWQRVRAAQQLGAIEEALAEMGEVTEQWWATHGEQLYREGMREADAALEGQVGAPARTMPAEEFAALHEASIQIIGENLATELTNALNLVGRTVDDVFRQAALSALQQATILGETRRQATKRMIADLAEQGITCFVDRAGKRWSLGTYSEMVARTTTREATEQGLTNRLAERDHDLVKITTHSGACPKCVPWEGKVVSLSGDSSEYPSMEEARAAGLFHPNCVHRSVPYVESYQLAAVS